MGNRELETPVFGWGATTPPALPTKCRLCVSAHYGPQCERVSEDITEVWSVGSPAQVLEGRSFAVDRGLHQLFGNGIAGADVAEAPALAREAADAADKSWPPLAAARRRFAVVK